MSAARKPGLARRVPRTLALVAGTVAFALGTATALSYRDPPPTLPGAHDRAARPALAYRDGTPMTVTYANRFNLTRPIALHDMPALLVQAFVSAEDRRFFRHGGVDWLARAHALVQNLRTLRVVRGASTISEQVVRMLRPRPRTLWSRWIEGFEAAALERRFGKAAVLEFYLNQVPYASNRRGVVQAARAYFGRSLDTLSDKEMLALAVLVRAPSALDLHRDSRVADARIARLGDRLAAAGVIDARGRASLARPLRIVSARALQPASHFARHVLARHAGRARAHTLMTHDARIRNAYKARIRTNYKARIRTTYRARIRTNYKARIRTNYRARIRTNYKARIRTTLDAQVQRAAQSAIDERLRALARAGARNGAVLAVDHERARVLAWAVALAARGGDIDAVTQPRQPGSTLKPFVYALALERGWTAATPIDDTPLVQRVGFGQHVYRNYSRRHYGPVSLRDALGNSLNIPAVRALAFVGAHALLERLGALGVEGLDRHPDVYGDGLALGNGEVSLLELVGAYAALANRGVYRPLELTDPGRDTDGGPPRRVFSEAVASLIADILSDPSARALEFGRGGPLALPVPTAVKTGTSSGHRDAWAIGFNHRYTVGVWIGNLDRAPMRGVTGSTGPAQVMRSVFAELNRKGETRPLYLSPRLVRAEACAAPSTRDAARCERRQEWFVPGTEPGNAGVPRETTARRASDDRGPRLRNPAHGVHLAMDPRIPDERERLVFELDARTVQRAVSVQWIVNGEPVARVERSGDTSDLRHAWRLRRGRHNLRARVEVHAGEPADGLVILETPEVSFLVR